MTPVKRQLKRYITLCANNADYQRKLTNLMRVVKSDEWKTVIQILWMMKNEMAIELLHSKKHTEDSMESKDVTQKVYHNISEWIDFLTDPKAWIGKKGLIQMIKGVKPETKEN